MRYSSNDPILFIIYILKEVALKLGAVVVPVDMLVFLSESLVCNQLLPIHHNICKSSAF